MCRYGRADGGAGGGGRRLRNHLARPEESHRVGGTARCGGGRRTHPGRPETATDPPRPRSRRGDGGGGHLVGGVAARPLPAHAGHGPRPRRCRDRAGRRPGRLPRRRRRRRPAAGADRGHHRYPRQDPGARPARGRGAVGRRGRHLGRGRVEADGRHHRRRPGHRQPGRRRHRGARTPGEARTTRQVPVHPRRTRRLPHRRPAHHRAGGGGQRRTRPAVQAADQRRPQPGPAPRRRAGRGVQAGVEHHPTARQRR